MEDRWSRFNKVMSLLGAGVLFWMAIQFLSKGWDALPAPLRSKMILTYGREVILTPRPLSSKGSFFGEDIRLAFSINTYTPLFDEEDLRDRYHKGQKVYAVWEKRGDEWEVAALESRQPGEGMFVKATVTEVIDAGYAQQVGLEYGFEMFHAPADSGVALIQKIRSPAASMVRVVLAVTPSGDAMIKRLE